MEEKLKKKVKIILFIILTFLALTVGLYLGKIILNFAEQGTKILAITKIEPTKMNNNILENDSEFLIYTNENMNKEKVKQSIYVEPALEYEIEKTFNQNEYKLTFEQDIPDNTIVKLQYIENKIAQDSWAYQTANRLSITGTYPAHESIWVDNLSVIEIEFSYANVEELQKNVEITPSISGTWQHIGKIWRFTPSEPLKDIKYEIKINSGLKAGEEVLENEYKFNFKVGEYEQNLNANFNTITIDGINVYKSDEAIKIYYENNNENQPDIDFSKVEIYKFNNTNEFIEYLKNKNYEKATNLGEYKFSKNKKYVQLNKTLQEGYYLAVLTINNETTQINCPIQINNLSAYAMETERDVLVWVAENEKLVKNIKVEYAGRQEKTNNDGIATFKNVADDSETKKYLTVGNAKHKLVVPLYNYDIDNYPQAYLYTDRPLYKNTDTINIWGFVPQELFFDKIEDEFYIELNEEGKEKIKVDKNGNINHTIKLNNHLELEYGNIILYYKDKVIASRSVSIEKYELPNYTYEIIAQKNYAYTNTQYEFDVKVSHITGLLVPNKKVKVKCDYYGMNEKEYIATTGENGIAHFAIDITKDNSETTFPQSLNIKVYNGDVQEYTEQVTYKSIYTINRDVFTKIEKLDKNTYEINLYKLAKNKNVEVNYNLEEIYDGKYDANVSIYLEENISERYIERYIYNEYTKQNEPSYGFKDSKDTKLLKTEKTANGKLNVDTSEVQFKEDTENKNYYYYLIFEYKDTKGRKIKEQQYVDDGYDYFSNGKIGYYYFDEYASGDMLYDVEQNINWEAYYTYRYLLKPDIRTFSIGDTVNFTLAESQENGISNIENNGTILKISLQEDIINTQIIKDNTINYKFTDNDYPGCKITSAYFYNGDFYRMPIYYFDFKETDRKIDVEIIPDKQEYKPGEEVNVTIKATNNGKPVKTSVNISVVNEAIFNLEEDITDLMETIYIDKTYPIYTYTTHIDYISNMPEGGGGGGGEIRGDFGDTAYFDTIDTDSKGVAKVKFELPDNITTYRITAHCANKDLYLGVNTEKIVSKLDFFIQSVEPRNVKTTDDLVLNATSIATSQNDVEYEFTIKELNRTLTKIAPTNSIATVNFGKLPYGKYTAIIKAKNAGANDAIQYEFEIIESAQEVKAETTMKINNLSTIKPIKNPVMLEIYNKEMGKYIEYIKFIESTITQRLDTQIAYNEAQKIKSKYYNSKSIENDIVIHKYMEQGYLKNLENGQKDLLLTALISYYAKQYYNENVNTSTITAFTQTDNVFEAYLIAAANNEPVLLDLLYLKNQKISGYDGLLLTLSLEFLGDYKSAKQVYSSTVLTKEEAEEYKSILAIIDTFINKENARNKIDELVKLKPSDEYLRFAILSFFQNNEEQISKQSTVKITSNNLNENIQINGMEIKKYTVNNNELEKIKFETDSPDLMVSYYYQTDLEKIKDKQIENDIKIKLLEHEIKKNSTATLQIDFNSNYEGSVRIALPNSMRLSENYTGDATNNRAYYLQNNQIDYITFYKSKECTQMEIPLIVTYEGNYKFENVVCYVDGIYHISNSVDINITE